MLGNMLTTIALRRENQRLRDQLQQREHELTSKELQLVEKNQQLVEKDQQHSARESELVAQFQARVEEINRLHEEEIEQLRQEQKLFILRVFAKRSERYIDDPRQLKLELSSEDQEFNEQVQDAVDGLLIAADEIKGDSDSGKKSRKKPRDRSNGKFPEHLPKQVIDIDLSDEQKSGLTHIGYDPVQKLHMKRPEFWVVEKRFHKYVDPSKQQPGVLSPPREEATGFTKGDHYDSSVVAEVLTSRFGYHLPYYRLQDMLMPRCGAIEA